MVSRELLPWLENPHRNATTRDLVFESVRRQLALGEDSASATPSDASSRILRNLGIQVRFPNDRYLQHGFEYYFKLLALRKLIGPIILQTLEQQKGRRPTNDEFVAAAQPFLGERGLQIAKKGIEGMSSPNMLADEQTVVTGVLTAILEGREVYIVTTDTDIPEQFGKLFLLIKEHYRAMLAAELYASRPDRMGFREVLVSDYTSQATPWAGASILELRLAENEFDVLPREFNAVVAHCILLGGGEKTPKVSYSCFTIDTETAEVLRVKAKTSGLSTDRFGDRNCTIRTGRLLPEYHEVIVSIGKEKTVRFEGWRSFGADDTHNVLTCCEEVTRVRPI
jgi:hypothetical protein